MEISMYSDASKIDSKCRVSKDAFLLVINTIVEARNTAEYSGF
jgi:hypothetical protein